MEPRPHQREALDAIRGIGPSGRALAVLACGTGKTLIGRLAALERAGRDGSIMLLVPSKELLRQTYEDWQREVEGGVEGLLVYSDPSVGDASATTDPGRIAGFLQSTPGRPKLLLCTYQSAARVAEAYAACPELRPLDVMVLDEAHRTAGPGARAYGAVLDDSHIPAATRISLTATAKTHPAGDGTQDVASMDNPQLYGKRVYELTFAESIRRGLLSDFVVTVVLVTDKEVHQVLLEQEGLPRGDELTTAQIAAQIAVARTIEEYGARRLIAFHGRRDRSRVFSSSMGRTAARVTGVPVEALHIDGTSPPEERRKALARLASPAAGGATVLSNVQILTEGVDVPSVDSVVFADPKTSEVAITQAVGRALRLHPGKDRPSVIVLPVYLAPGENAEQVLAGSDFRHVWAVLTRLRDFDERMDAAFTQARVESGEKEFTAGERTASLPGAVHILGEDSVVRGKLHEALKLHILDHTTESWLDRYGKLKAYMDFTGEMPKGTYVSPKGDALGKFVSAQKLSYRKGTLLAERARLLEALPGWDWGKSRTPYPEIDTEAVEALVRRFREAQEERADLEERAQKLIALAYEGEKLIPGYKFPMTKFSAWTRNLLLAMQGWYVRAEQNRQRREAEGGK